MVRNGQENFDMVPRDRASERASERACVRARERVICTPRTYNMSYCDKAHVETVPFCNRSFAKLFITCYTYFILKLSNVNFVRAARARTQVITN